MDFVSVPGLGEHVSTIGFGCAAIGGYDYGRVNDADSVASIHEAVDRGINFFDTADVYGFGHSEKVLGHALSSVRSEVYVATKVGVRWTPTGSTVRDSSPEHIRTAAEASLQRLRREYIDLYQIHWHDQATPIEATLETLSDLVAEGKIRTMGCCNFGSSLLKSALAIPLPQSTSLRTTQLSVNVGDTTHVFDASVAVASGLTALAYNVLAQGIYSGKYGRESSFEGTDLRRRSALFAPDSFDTHLRALDRIQTVARGGGHSSVQTAVRWVLDATPISIALVGFKHPSQVAEAVGAVGWRLGSEEINLLSNASEESDNAEVSN
jgi:aryl-alcohol dehydrogenase-like predicted oxidoreductase